MAKDFAPIPDQELNQWLLNLREKISDHGPGLGLTATDITNAQQLCDEYTAQIHAAYQARAASKAAVNKKQQMRTTHLRPLRHIINKMKASPAFQDSSAADLRVMSHPIHADAREYKPKLKAVMGGEMIEVRFKKKGVQAMEFRVKVAERITQGEWKSLGIRFYSPLYYKPENYVPGTVVRVWFMAVGIKKDEQFGLWSDPVSALYFSE